MEIQINEKYRIASGSRCWMIKHPVLRGGKISWEPCKWYDTVESCVNGLGQQMVRDSNAQSVVEAIKDVERVCTQLSSALSPQFEVKRRTAAIRAL